MQENRSLRLLKFLLSKEDYISMKEIAKHLEVSSRTVYSDINTPAFKRLLCGASVVKKTKLGVKLIVLEPQMKRIRQLLDRQNIEPKASDVPSFDSINSILFLLFSRNTPVTADFIAKYLYKSKAQLEPDFNRAEQWLSPYRIALVRKQNSGISISGAEHDVREALKTLCFHFQPPEHTADPLVGLLRLHPKLKATLERFFSREALHKVIEIVNMSEVNLNENFTDRDYETLVTRLCILTFRCRIGKTVKNSRKFTNELREFLLAKLIKIEIDAYFDLDLHEDELFEITQYVLAARRQGISGAAAMPDAAKKNVINQFMRLLSDSLNVDLIQDDELRVSLFTHLVPAIRRMRYGIKIENPLLTQIKYEYTDVYIAVMTLIEEFEKSENIYFDANELGFICLHIAAAMNRADKKRSVAACLICEGGLTISTYLKSKIERQFNEIEIVKIVNQHELAALSSDQFSLIFNSAHTQNLVADHVIAITPMLDETDQEAIRAWIINQEYQKIVSQNHQIKNNILFFQDKSADRDMLLAKYCKLLEVDQHVNSGFLTSVLEREKRASTSLGRGIAVPHGSGLLVKNSIILIIRLDEPIAWDGQSVDLIFLIAINFNENKNYHYFFEKLFRIISNDILLKELKSSSSTIEMATLLFKESEDTSRKC